MAETTPWRELHRTSDPQELLAIMTCIAAMEFDVRCLDAQGRAIATSDFGDDNGLAIIEVRTEDHAALQDVLNEIIAEQDEFDAMLEQGAAWTWSRLVISLIAIAGIAIVLWMSSMPR